MSNQERDQLHAEKLRMMKIESIRKEIERLNTKKKELEDKQKEYENFKTEMSDLSSDASKIAGEVDGAKGTFVKNIKTTRAQEEVGVFDKVAGNLSSISSGINCIIIPAVDIVLKKLKKDIRNVNYDIIAKTRDLKYWKNKPMS